jgi:hypothetical protein
MRTETTPVVLTWGRYRNRQLFDRLVPTFTSYSYLITLSALASTFGGIPTILDFRLQVIG